MTYNYDDFGPSEDFMKDNTDIVVNWLNGLLAYDKKLVNDLFKIDCRFQASNEILNDKHLVVYVSSGASDDKKDYVSILGLINGLLNVLNINKIKVICEGDKIIKFTRM